MDKNKILINIVSWLVIIVMLVIALNFYKNNNFNEFIKSELNLNTSEFKRDNKVKYSNASSYRISSEKDNDVTFYKKVKVQKNTPYKVTCMVKIEDVVPTEEISGVGAQISIIGTTEKSVAITGTQDWQKIEMIFNSQSRDEVNIGYRLGGYLGTCTGTAWFSDFKLEAGVSDTSSNWKFACLIFENTDVVINGNEIKISMNYDDKIDIKDTINRFKNTAKDLSKSKMTANCDIYNIEQPITKLSYDNQFGYFVASEDIEDQIKDIIEQNDYDHIFAIIRLGNDEYKDDIEINDWIGLRFNGLSWNRIFKYKITKFIKELYV